MFSAFSKPPRSSNHCKRQQAGRPNNTVKSGCSRRNYAVAIHNIEALHVLSLLKAMQVLKPLQEAGGKTIMVTQYVADELGAAMQV
jgi:hypothetical protein